MNNMFAAKLSELVYTASDHPDSLSEMEEFDRLILLIRKTVSNIGRATYPLQSNGLP